MFGDGSATRDYLFVHDVVDALYVLLDAEDAHDIHNWATGIETSVLGSTEHIERISGRAPEALEPARIGEVESSVPDASAPSKL